MALPNFIIIGAYKSGTTSLYHYFRQHPEVFMSRIKEPNYFAHEELAELMRHEGQEPNLIDCPYAYRELFSDVRDEKAVGEASPAYLNHPRAAKRIRRTIPGAKLIAILRHPVDAFYSDHNMRIRDGRRLESDFLGRFKAWAERLRAGETAGPLYHAQLQAFCDHFDPAQMKVYLYDDLMKDSTGVMQDAYRFVGVDDSFVPDTSDRRNAGGVPRSRMLDRGLGRALGSRQVRRLPGASGTLSLLRRANTRQFPPLCPALRRELTDVFRDDIQQLSRFLGRDLRAWLK